MWSVETLVLLAAVFFAGGLVKGVIGTGLPTTVIALLAAFFDVRTAIMLLMVPAIATNIRQALTGGALLRLSRRLAPMLVTIGLGVAIGLFVLSSVGNRVLVAILGIILCAYAVASLLRLSLPEPGAREPATSALIGLINGTITGITGTFVMPSVIYLQVLGLSRRELLQAMGITFLFSILALTAGLGLRVEISSDLGLLSLLAVIPAMAGQAAGQAISDRLSERTFRTLFLCGLFALGIYLAARAALGI